MEDQLRGVPGVEYVRSASVVGLSQVVLIFKMGADLMEARQRVQERVKLAIAELPPVLRHAGAEYASFKRSAMLSKGGSP
jgi:Cu/Ag efflux pump CusA